MSRITGVYKASDFPGNPDDKTRDDLKALFKYLFPESDAGEIDREHGGFAIVAQNPRLALHLAQLTNFMVCEMGWTSQRVALRELAIQALNLHFKCDYSFRAHVESARAHGISDEMQAAIPEWASSGLFNQEQRLTLEYTFAVVTGHVPDELFARVVREFGEKQTVEFTSGIAWWAFWAMIINATRP